MSLPIVVLSWEVLGAVLIGGGIGFFLASPRRSTIT